MIREMAKKMKDEGYRLVCITAVDLGEVYELIYHFSKGKEVKDIREIVRKGERVKSISDIFPNAYIYEWEEGETIGVKFENYKKLFGEEG